MLLLDRSPLSSAPKDNSSMVANINWQVLNLATKH